MTQDLKDLLGGLAGIAFVICLVLIWKGTA